VLGHHPYFFEKIRVRVRADSEKRIFDDDD
jgi:hypothetical protein